MSHENTLDHAEQMQELLPKVHKAGPVTNRRTTSVEADWRLDVITTERGFDALEVEWNTLAAESTCSVFQTFDWLRTWWKHFGRGRRHAQLHIIVLSRSDTTVAIAPLYSDVISVLGLARVTCLSFIGRESSDYLDVIVREGMHQEVYPRLAEHLHANRDRWGCIVLEDIPDRSLTHTMLQSALAWRGMRSDSEITEQCPRIPLPLTWEQYLAMHSNQFRREYRRRERNLVKGYAATYETIACEEEFDKAFRDFITLHQHRWTSNGDCGVFAGGVERDFHIEAARTLFSKGLVRLSFLRLNGKRVAGSYAFSHGNEFSLYVVGMGDAGSAQRYSPGRQLHCYSIQQAISEGASVVDFMRGREEYKYDLGAVDSPSWTLTAYATSGAKAETMRRKRSANLLYRSLRTRTRKELLFLGHTVRANGMFSRATFTFLSQRPKQLLGDARKKIHAPGKPLYID